MKNIFYISIYVFLLLSANLMAQTVLICDLKVYVEDRIYCLNDQLNDISFDQYSHHAGYLFGQKTAYEDINNYMK